jgi:hypothetical protein
MEKVPGGLIIKDTVLFILLLSVLVDLPVSDLCRIAIVISRPWISIQQLSLSRADQGTETEILLI